MWSESVKFGNPEGFTVPDDMFFVGMNIFYAHERQIVYRVAGRIEVVNDGKFLLVQFNVRFCVSESCVQLSSCLTNVLEVATRACDEVDHPMCLTVNGGGDGK